MGFVAIRPNDSNEHKYFWRLPTFTHKYNDMDYTDYIQLTKITVYNQPG